MTGKNANFGQIYEFFYSRDFWKAVATAFLGTSKLPMVNFEINFFLFICSKMFVFQSHKFVPQEAELTFGAEIFFGYAPPGLICLC